MPSENNPDSVILQVTLAEFSVLRAEISKRSEAQNSLISLNITALGTVGGFVLSQRADLKLLLLLPILSPVLGILYLDHGTNIANIGRYIDERIKPVFSNLAQSPSQTGYSPLLLEYESFARKYEQRMLLRFLTFGIPIFTIFCGLPGIALIFTILQIRNFLTFSIWLIGFFFVLLYLWFWIALIFQPFFRARGQAERSSTKNPLP
jgi:hypothetical protein